MLEAHKRFIVIPWEIHHSPAFPTSLPFACAYMHARTHIHAHFFNTYADRHSSTWGIFAFLLWYNLLYFVHPLIIFGKVSRFSGQRFLFPFIVYKYFVSILCDIHKYRRTLLLSGSWREHCCSCIWVCVFKKCFLFSVVAGHCNVVFLVRSRPFIWPGQGFTPLAPLTFWNG